MLVGNDTLMILFVGDAEEGSIRRWSRVSELLLLRQDLRGFDPTIVVALSRYQSQTMYPTADLNRITSFSTPKATVFTMQDSVKVAYARLG